MHGRKRDCLRKRLLKGWRLCGHDHTEKKIDKLEIMFENFDAFCVDKINT